MPGRPDDHEVQAQIYKAQRHGLEDSRWVTRWPGATFEQGVVAALAWVLGQTEDKPVPE